MARAELARLRAKPPEDRRIAIVLSHCSGTREAATKLLGALDDAGYRIENTPADSAVLAARLGVEPEESLSFASYSAVFATLPMSMQQQVSAQWGAAERDPLFRPGRLDCGRFAIAAARCGNIAVLVPPAGGRSAPVPPHSYLAAYVWLSDDFRADAVIDLGGHDGGLAESLILGRIPHLSSPVVDGEVGRHFVDALDSDGR